MKRPVCIVLCLTIVITQCITAFADVSAAKAAVKEYISGVDTGALCVDDDWLVLALAKSGEDLPEPRYNAYYNSLCAKLKENNGVLNERRYTDYSRTIIALTAVGKDPRDVAGYDLTEKLADFDSVVKQGINGSIYALIALDCGCYEIPKCPVGKTQATRALYLERILNAQNADGSFSLAGDGDSDVTAMALQALSRYTDKKEVNIAVEKALDWLSSNRTEDGGFVSRGEENCESAAQVLTALGELGIDADTDERFAKNGVTVADNVLSFARDGGYAHLHTQTSADKMATEQALYSLVSYIRQKEGKPSLYTMKEKTEDTENKIVEWSAKAKAAFEKL